MSVFLFLSKKIRLVNHMSKSHEVEMNGGRENDCDTAGKDKTKATEGEGNLKLEYIEGSK